MPPSPVSPEAESSVHAPSGHPPSAHPGRHPVRSGYPRARVDALTDGIFAVAMTLLVLDIHLPDNFAPHSAADLASAVLALWPKALAYAISFMILGSRWLSNVRYRRRGEEFPGKAARWWIYYLLFITCLPFSTSVVGRFASYPMAVWVYAGNSILISLASWQILSVDADDEDGGEILARKVTIFFLLVSSVVAVIWSLRAPQSAMYAYLINFASPRVSALLARRYHAPR